MIEWTVIDPHFKDTNVDDSDADIPKHSLGLKDRNVLFCTQREYFR